ICDWSALPGEMEKLATDIGANKKVSRPFAVLGVLDSPELLRASAKVFADASCPKDEALGRIIKRPPGKRIRIGYYSADFSHHATSHLMAGLFEAHDTDAFELYGFSFAANAQDDMHRRVSEAFVDFTDVTHKSDREVARISRELGIDIAVDLKGYTRN